MDGTTSRGENAMTKTAHRPQTPHDFSLLKTLRYDHVSDLSDKPLPPLPIAPTSSASSTTRNQHTSGPTIRPVASISRRGSLRDSNATENDDIKRDSALAPSDTSTSRAGTYNSALSDRGFPSTVPKQSTSPVETDNAPPLRTRSSKSSFLRWKKKQLPAIPVETPSDPAITTHSAQGHTRIKSFHPISMDIPSGALVDMDPGKLDFSKRGSVMLDGAQTQEHAQEQTAAQGQGQGQGPGQGQGESRSSSRDSPANGGLKTGRRTPSVQMLQAAAKGRVLSMEDVTFSMRVRSMYEHGDENGAGNIDRVLTSDPTEVSGPATEPQIQKVAAPSSDAATLKVDKVRPSHAAEHVRTAPPADNGVRAAYNSRDPHEIAGGIEDWQDVQGRDVDRYGFIKPSQNISRTPSKDSDARAPASAAQKPGMQRISTSLQLISSEPRRKRSMRRAPSTAKSARHVAPPTRGSDTNTIRTKASRRSFKTTDNSSFPSPFRSSSRRLVDGASDMLTLPPGLADIAEQEDAGRTANMLKQREWSREEKWRKMARLTNRSSQGGGMAFDFDTHDLRLISRTWKGIPDRWRATAWHAFLSASAARRQRVVNSISDDDLISIFHDLQDQSSADDMQIDVDVPRTISMHIMFRRRYRGGQRLLFRVLHAIALHFPDVGYVQGMASLAATLLCYYDEERAFVMLVRLWELRGLRALYKAGFAGLMAALDAFEKDWLGDDKVIAKQLDEMGISSTAYGTRWYLTLFNMSIPFPAQLRVWDVFMLLGDQVDGPFASAHTTTKATTSQEDIRPNGDNVNINNNNKSNDKGGEKPDFAGADLDVLHATSAALIDATREILLDSDFENAMKVLTSWVPIKDEDLLMKVAKAEWKAKKKSKQKQRSSGRQ